MLVPLGRWLPGNGAGAAEPGSQFLCFEYNVMCDDHNAWCNRAHIGKKPSPGSTPKMHHKWLHNSYHIGTQSGKELDSSLDSTGQERCRPKIDTSQIEVYRVRDSWYRKNGFHIQHR